jgi:hypothetical protein
MFLGYEFRKQISGFSLLITIILFVLNIGMTAYIYRGEFGTEKKEAVQTRQRLIDLYVNDRAGYQSIYDDYQSRLSDYNALLYSSFSDSRIRVVFENKLINYPSYGDQQLFSDVEKALGAAVNYKDSIASLLRDAALRLKEAGSRGGYTYKYHIKLISYYDKFNGNDIGTTEIAGWNEFFLLQTPVIFIVLASLGVVCGVFTADSRTGMTNILRVSKRGGRPVTASKLGYTAAASAFISVSFTLSPLIVFALSCGLSSSDRPVQSLDAFTFCRYEISIWQYLVIYTLVRALVFLIFSLTAAVLGQYTRSEIPAFIFTAALAGLGAALSNIDPVSKYYYLQKFSSLEIANVNILFTRFRGLNIFGSCADYTAFIICSLGILIVTVLVMSVIKKPEQAIMVRKEKNKSGTPRSVTMSLFISESYKQLVCVGGMYIILVALLLKCVVSGLYYRPVQSVGEAQYISYINQVKGLVTGEKLEAVDKEKSYIEESITSYGAAENAYRRGEMTDDEFAEYKGRYDYAQYYKNACDRFSARRDYLAELYNSHENIEFIYEEGVERLLSSPPDIAALLTAVFVCGNIFAGEYQSGFFRILRTSKKGRNKTFVTKTSFSLLLATAIYIAFSAADIFFMTRYYNIDYLGASILSMPSLGELVIDMNILSYIIIYKAISFAGYIVCFMLITSLSALLGSHIKAMTASVLILFVPFAADYYRVTVLHPINFTYFMAPSDITAGIYTYILCSAVASVIFVLSKIKWNGRIIR